MIRLGRLKISNPFLFAPMSKFSDISMRQLIKNYGAAYTFTELVLAEEFIKKTEAQKRRLDLFDKNNGMQFITNDPSALRKAIEIVKNREFYENLGSVASIDLNLGCPENKYLKQNMGSALLNQPDKVRELFSTLVKYSDVPVSAKIRLAINSKHKTTKPYLRIGKIAQDEGLDFLTVHGRTAGQMYTGEVDYNAFSELKLFLEIPIVTNGNICDEDSAKKLFQFGNAVMIGRHAVSNPFIFRQLNHFIEHGRKMKVDIESEKLKALNQYLVYSRKYETGFQIAKIHVQAFLKDLPKYDELRKNLTHLRNMDELTASLMKNGLLTC